MIWAFILVIVYFVAFTWLSMMFLRRGETRISRIGIIPPRIHGVLDYLVGALLIALPWLFGVDGGGGRTLIPVLLGAGTIVYSLFTDYQLGLVRRIPLRVHLGLDAAAGLFLIAAPFLFSFARDVMDPYLAIGVLEVVAAVATDTSLSGQETTSATSH